MKILSKSNWKFCYCCLLFAKDHLLQCKQQMKGKYGSSWVVRDIDNAVRDIDAAISFAPKYKNRNKSKYPPNTPKARRLGWYKEGEPNER